MALSRPLRVVGVTHHRVLWSPDFPPCRLPRTAIAQPTPNVERDHTEEGGGEEVGGSFQSSVFSCQRETLNRVQEDSGLRFNRQFPQWQIPSTSD